MTPWPDFAPVLLDLAACGDGYHNGVAVDAVQPPAVVIAGIELSAADSARLAARQAALEAILRRARRNAVDRQRRRAVRLGLVVVGPSGPLRAR
jgi:hypothetical protein